MHNGSTILPACSPDLRPLRQRLVRLYSSTWETLLESRLDFANDPLIRAWALNGWPLIVRRRQPSETRDYPLGLPLPPSAGKRRVALEVSAEDIQSVTWLPSIADVMLSAPAGWRPCMRALDRLARKYDVRAGVFGSLGWQFLTGWTYLGITSDLDIAWDMPHDDRIEALLDDLAEVALRSPFRLDGELVRPDGAGVNWRELHNRHAEVAVRALTEARLISRDLFLKPLP